MSCPVVPTAIDAVDGVTDTEPTAGVPGVTLTSVEPDLPSLVAIIMAEPAVLPITTPSVVTVATAAFEEDQVTVRPASTFPSTSAMTVASTCD